MKELNPISEFQQNPEISHESCDPVLQSSSAVTSQDSKIEEKQHKEEEQEHEEEELRRLLLPNVEDLPDTPPSAVEANFTTLFALDFMKPGHDQYVRRHANGLCNWFGSKSPTHVAFKDKGGITSVDFNVGKSDRSGIKVTGKRKKNAQHFESDTALCKVCTGDASYVLRCCVKGSLLEVNERLIKQPELLYTSPERRDTLQLSCQDPQIGSRQRLLCWTLNSIKSRELSRDLSK